MSKLKTLNEINPTGITGCLRCESIGEACGMCDRKELKAEAVKWVKNAQDEMERLQERATKGLHINKLEIWENIGKSNVLMDFFNLTEEDLK